MFSWYHFRITSVVHRDKPASKKQPSLRVHNGKLKVSCIIGSQRETRQVHATLVFIIAFKAHKRWKPAKTPDEKKTEDVTRV